MSKNLEMLIENYLMEKSSDISELLVPTDLKTFLYNYSKNNISNLIKDKKNLMFMKDHSINSYSFSLFVDGWPIINRNNFVTNKIKNVPKINIYFSAKLNEIDKFYSIGLPYKAVFIMDPMNETYTIKNTDKEKEIGKFLEGDFRKKLIEWYKKIYIPSVESYNSTVKRIHKNPKGPFGKVFAGDERNLPEKNNDKEQQLVWHIKDYVNGSKERITKYDASYIKNFLKKDLYKDVVIEPKQKYVYRGMSIPLSTFEKLFKKTKKNDGIIKFSKPVVFKPLTGRTVSSWTLDKDVTDRFIGNSSVDVILFAKVSQNKDKFFSLEEWYKQICSSYSSEKEVFGLGPIKVEQIYFFKKGW